MPSTDATTRQLEARRIRGLQLAVALAAVVVVARVTPWTQNFFIFPLLEGFAYDLLFSASRPDPPGNIVIVEIDEKSLRELGRFQSWHRDLYAALLDRLDRAQVVAFDILFPEPDVGRTSWLTGRGFSWPSARVGGTADSVFAAAIRRHGRVVLAAHWGSASEGTAEEGVSALAVARDVKLPSRLAVSGRRVRAPAGYRLIPPTAELCAAAAAVGHVDLYPDPDGVYRRFPPLLVGGGIQSVHFAVAIAGLVSPRPGGAGGPDADTVVPDRDGHVLINYCGPSGTVPRVSFVDVLREPRVAEQLAGKIVIVGATAPGLYDIRPAPYRQGNRQFFGVETNACVVDTLLRRRALRDMSGSYTWGALALVLGVLTGLAVWHTKGEVQATALSLLVLVVVAAPSFLVAFHLLGTWIPYGAFLLASALPLVVGLPERLTAEKRLIERNFGVYVSPEVLRELMNDPQLIRQSQRRKVTLLFSDVRGSTTLSEKMPPEQWVAQLNEYLSQMSLAVFAYDGYLDKFMGDGIMAVWNAFGTQPNNHAELAVRAGLQMLRRLELLNRKWEQDPERTPLRIGIGIHSGEAIMGNVGSEDRVQYTAIGDVVNTASRIEGMTKTFGVELIVSQDTAQLLGDGFALRELGETEVRGRSQPVKVFQVLTATPATIEGGDLRHHVREEEESRASD